MAIYRTPTTWESLNYRAEPRALPREFWSDGYLAQCFVPDDAPQYRQLLARFEQGDAGAMPAVKEGSRATMRVSAQIVPGGLMVPYWWVEARRRV